MAEKPLILIVEDDHSTSFLIEKMLEVLDYDTVTAFDGTQALEVVQGKLFDLILLDIMMPGLNGFEVCRRLKLSDNTKNIPVIFITAHNSPDSIAEGFKVGGIDYITKPFKNEELIARVKTHVELSHIRKNLEGIVRERTFELEEANKQLKKASKHKDEFLANMSHEFRTPLNTILSLSEALSEKSFGDLNETQLRYIGSISDSGRHLLSLVNDILDIAKIEAGKLTLDYSTISINSFLQSTIHLVRQAALLKKIAIETEIQEGIDRFYADEKRMKQIIVNLLSNAIKFTDKHKKVGVLVSSGDCEIHFEVWDEGIGIKPESQQFLFIPFMQIDSKLSRKFEGTGLGLSLVKNLVDLHHGKISVYSKVGVGSTFKISLPLKV